MGLVAVAVLALATLLIGSLGLRLARTTSDFYVASRRIGPIINASAIGGEYLSGASFLGVAGLTLISGTDRLWYPVGWTAGFLVLLVLVAAPLRRSGAYTLPDFAEARLDSRSVRRLCSVLVVLIAWLYLIPQFQGAILSLGPVVGGHGRVAEGVVVLVVLANVLAGGMRSITLAQAFQFWVKLTALLVPVLFLLMVWWGRGAPSPAASGPDPARWVAPLDIGAAHPLYLVWSLVLATFLGTMGLPHVVVRFYTNPDGRAARRTTLVVLCLLGLFYLLPPVYGALGRVYAPDLIASGRADTVVLALPGRMVGGAAGDVLTALIAAGAFAAFVSTSSGLAVAVSGVLSQDVFGRRLGPITAFRVAALIGVLVPALLAWLAPDVSLARSVGLAFAVAASTFCPLLVLGIWWRRLTDAGAIAGLAAGGLASYAAVVDALVGPRHTGWTADLLAQPAAWTVPLAFATMIAVSLATPARIPGHVQRFLIRLHAPEAVVLDRGPGLVRPE